jgi:type IV secretory pathway TrbD component
MRPECKGRRRGTLQHRSSAPECRHSAARMDRALPGITVNESVSHTNFMTDAPQELVIFFDPDQTWKIFLKGDPLKISALIYFRLSDMFMRYYKTVVIGTGIVSRPLMVLSKTWYFVIHGKRSYCIRVLHHWPVRSDVSVPRFRNLLYRHSALTASVVSWSEFLATDPEVRVRFPALTDFLRNSGSGTGSAQPREYNWGANWKKN